MSLLNITNDGLPNVLLALCETLLAERGNLSEQELLIRIAPASVVEDAGQMVHQTLAKWTDLGLFVKEGDQVQLSPKYFPKAARQRGDAGSVIRRAARECALDPENNPDLWAREGAKAADLTRALAWLLAQDVYGTTMRTLEQQESNQLKEPELRLVQNDTRRNGLQKWGYFLGFTRQPEDGDIDPTRAVLDAIDAWEPQQVPMSFLEFLARLNQELPVLDAGSYRVQVEQRLDRNAIPELTKGHLSTALSRALLCLRASGRLSLGRLSDAADSVVLSGYGGAREDLRFTHVQVVPGSAE